MNREATISSLTTPISPPPSRRALPPQKSNDLAAIESGQITPAEGHFQVIISQITEHIRPQTSPNPTPQIQIPAWKALYRRNATINNGTHFVIHQHDHPVAGPHYDLRLQFSQSSSLSWSIMYGLPGDANSRRINRNATETRVHCLWNHLIETASSKTGSLIIWDTGEYEILDESLDMTVETESESEHPRSESDPLPDGEKLRRAFRNKKIRLRLHGTRLPHNYTVLLRLDKSDLGTKQVIPRKRRRISKKEDPPQETTTDDDSSSSERLPRKNNAKSDVHSDSDSGSGSTSNKENSIREQICRENAYPGSTNDIGSVHQRRWFLSLDRVSSGFVEERDSHSGKKKWVRRRDPRSGRLLGFDPFHVRGPEVERSVVTGRSGRDVLEDEKVDGFRPRRGWKAVVE